jgi:prepilin-type N-terminal cleavage/methylation domain-containing protein
MMSMKTGERGRRGFTLVEVMVAISIGLVPAGAAVFLLFQTATEMRRGLAATTVEQKADGLQAKLARCLRCKSGNMGLTPDYTSGYTDGAGNFIGYQTVYAFLSLTNGSYVREKISFDSATGVVTYTSNMVYSAQTTRWMSNSATVKLRTLCFTPSYNLDGSLDCSLVNVTFSMDDNSFGRHVSVNNPASIYRTFSVQMRAD